MSVDTATIETDVRDLVERGDVAGATSTLLDAYGADVFGFMVGVLENARRARAAYLAVTKQVADGLAAFAWTYPLRVWLYALARRELVERRANVEPDETQRVGAVEVRLLSVIEAVRRALTEEERELLILRVDRDLDWRSLAITQLGEGASEAAIVHEARVLRARIEQLLARVQSLIELQLRNVT